MSASASPRSHGSCSSSWPTTSTATRSKGAVDAALSGATDTLSLTDRRGREVLVPAAKIAYVEVGVADGERRMGFGT